MSDNPFIRCGCGASWPCAKHPDKTTPESESAKPAAPAPSDAPTCETCKGEGQILVSQRTGESDFEEWTVDCPVCDCAGTAPQHVQSHVAFLNARIKHLQQRLVQAGVRAMFATSGVSSQASKSRILTALETPACERLRDFYNVGPVQRAAVDAFVDALARKEPT